MGRGSPSVRTGRRPIVTLEAGEKIEFFEGVEGRHGHQDLQADHAAAAASTSAPTSPRSRKATSRRSRSSSTRRATGGRNHHGRITSRFRGGGHKQRYRIIDFSRDKIGVPAKVASIEYDPNRTARIALLHYVDGEKRYILAPDGLKVGDTSHLEPQRRHQAGQLPAAARHPARHDDPQRRDEEGQGRRSSCRSAGVGAQLMAKEGD